MTLQMTNTKASKVFLEDLPVIEAEEHSTPDVKLTFQTAFNVKDTKAFAVAFSIVVKTTEFKLEMDYWVGFEASEEITEDQRDSPFFAINAPAIGFPFLRSYVSLILINGGYSNTILGSVNFVELYERNQANRAVLEKE